MFYDVPNDDHQHAPAADVCKGARSLVEGERCGFSSYSLLKRLEVHEEENLAAAQITKRGRVLALALTNVAIFARYLGNDRVNFCAFWQLLLSKMAPPIRIWVVLRFSKFGRDPASRIHPSCEDPRRHAWSMCASCFCPCMSLSRATPLGRSRHQTSEFLNTSEFPTGLRAARVLTSRSPSPLGSCVSTG